MTLVNLPNFSVSTFKWVSVSFFKGIVLLCLLKSFFHSWKFCWKIYILAFMSAYFILFLYWLSCLNNNKAHKVKFCINLFVHFVFLQVSLWNFQFCRVCALRIIRITVLMPSLFSLYSHSILTLPHKNLFTNSIKKLFSHLLFKKKF